MKLNIKKVMQKTMLSLVLGLLSVVVGQAQIVTNGSFETGAAALNYDLDPGPGVVNLGIANFQLPTGWSFSNVTGGSTPWTALSGTVNEDPNGYFGSSQSGSYFVSLQTGSSELTALGVISQTINGLTIGQQYQVNGFVRARDVASQTGTYQISLSSAGSVTSGSPTSDTIWSAFSGTFTATNASDNLNLGWSHASGVDQTVHFDNISIIAVPEPSTYLMLTLGLASLFVLRRRCFSC
jgi:hypothetical protein